MTKSAQRLGRWGESLAATYLVEHGYTILERNMRTSYGEIDLIARDGETIVFIEVKTGKTPTFGMPEISVNSRKQAHLLAAAQTYMQAHPDHQGEWRIDVIAIQGSPTEKQPIITHFENALS